MSANSRDQAQAQLDSIVQMVEALSEAERNEDYNGVDAAERLIQQDALDVSVRSGWVNVGDLEAKGAAPEEFRILLCTGGPAVRIVGDLDTDCCPTNVRLEHQDWFTPWEELRLSDGEYDAVKHYCSQYYFGG